MEQSSSQSGQSAAPSKGGKSTKPPRILSCSACQRKKIRCDRHFPCANCLKAKIDCIPVAPSTSRRAKRYAQKDLLERLKRCEDLLEKHSIKYEPVLSDISKLEQETGTPPEDNDSDNDPIHTSGGEDRVKPGRGSLFGSPAAGGKRIESFWKRLHREFHEIDGEEHPASSSEEEFGESTIQKAWDHVYNDTDLILFGAWARVKSLTPLHPQPVHIFRLWQIYLDNINPLLKITHSPSLQQRFVEAATDISKIKPGLEALMFGIYCTALSSINEEECMSAFGEEKRKLECRYQACCQQALLKAGFLRTFDREVLVAYFLFLVSVRPNIDHRSFHSMLGIAVRIALRLGLHTEASNQTHSPFEAEMRRRLWWQIVLLDSRMSEMAHSRSTLLLPTWDCQIPVNLNDGDFSPQVQKVPASRIGPTESLFIVLRCEIADFSRHTALHLETYAPLLMGLAKELMRGRPTTVDEFEKMLVEKYLRDCDTQMPLHFVSRYMSFNLVGKIRFGEYIMNKPVNPGPELEKNRDRMFEKVIEMMEVDTELQTSPLTRGFRWLICIHFPLPAYFFMLQRLRRTGCGPLIDRAWEAMVNNFTVRDLFAKFLNSSLARPFGRLILRAWEVRERALNEAGASYVVPNIVTIIRERDSATTTSTQTEYSSPEDANIPFWSELYAPLVQPSTYPQAFLSSMSDFQFSLDGTTGLEGNGMAFDMENLAWLPPYQIPTNMS